MTSFKLKRLNPNMVLKYLLNININNLPVLLSLELKTKNCLKAKRQTYHLGGRRPRKRTRISSLPEGSLILCNKDFLFFKPCSSFAKTFKTNEGFQRLAILSLNLFNSYSWGKKIQEYSTVVGYILKFLSMFHICCIVCAANILPTKPKAIIQCTNVAH